MKIIAVLICPVLFLIAFSVQAQRSVSDDGIRFTVKSIKVLEDTLFFSFQLTNRSLLNYHLTHVRCYTQPRHIPRRSAVQQTDQQPTEVLALQAVPAHHTSRFIIPYPAFAIPHERDLYIQVTETGRVRTLQLRLKGKRFLRMIGPH